MGKRARGRQISQLPHNSGNGYVVRNSDGKFGEYVEKPITHIPIEKKK